MGPHFVLGRENVPCLAEVVKADSTDFTAIGRSREEEKNVTFPDSEGFICKEKVDTQIWLESIWAWALHCFLWRKLFSTSASSAAKNSRALRSSSNCFLSWCLFICVTYLMNSKCKKVDICLMTSSYGGGKQKVLPEIVLT